MMGNLWNLISVSFLFYNFYLNSNIQQINICAFKRHGEEWLCLIVLLVSKACTSVHSLWKERVRDLWLIPQYQFLDTKCISEAQLYICISQEQLKKGRPAQSFFFFADESFWSFFKKVTYLAEWIYRTLFNISDVLIFTFFIHV